MNGSSNFRGVPLNGGGSSTTNNPNTNSDMNSALRPHHPAYFPRLESLASPLYGPGELSRLFPTAHLSALHAAMAAASNIPQTTTHHGMPPPTLSQFHQAAAAAVAANRHAAAAHHQLLSPFLYPHLSSPAYGGQPGPSASATGPTPSHPPPPQFGTGPPRHPPYGYSAAESAFLPTTNVMPRYRYLLPTTTSPSIPTMPLATPAARLMNTAVDRSLSESEFIHSAGVIARARRPSSPTRLIPPLANIPTTSVAVNVDAQPTNNASRIDQRPNTIPSSGTMSTTADSKASVIADGKKKNSSSCLPTQPYYPSHFMKGTVIQLANGDLKRVEELNTEDFIKSAHLTNELKIDTSQVVKIEEKTGDIVLLTFSVGGNKVQVSVEATVEHPFFVIGQGWSSFNPERTRNLYGLPCQRLQVGDVCISLTHRDIATRTTPSTGSTVASGAFSNKPSLWVSDGGNTRPQIASESSVATGKDTSSSLHDARKQMLNTRATGKRCNDNDDRLRKKRKMTSPVRIGIPPPQLSPLWAMQRLDHRSAMTPPETRTQPASPRKVRRWSVS